MADNDWLALQFEGKRAHLRAVAYRMLGSLSEADDALQEAWLNVSRAGASGVDNLGGWLTTVVARVCLDMLRSRKVRGEESLDAHLPQSVAGEASAADPEQEALLATSVGLALLVVLETLEPAERLAFVLHDMFALPFEEIAPIVKRTPTAARQLASRARRRLQGAPLVPESELSRQREVVAAYLAATRTGDLAALTALLAPEVVLHADGAAYPSGTPTELHGADSVARRAISSARGARFAQPALVDGAAGLIVAPRGRLLLALKFTFADSKIAHIDVVADPDRVAQLELALLGDDERGAPTAAS